MYIEFPVSVTYLLGSTVFLIIMPCIIHLRINTQSPTPIKLNALGFHPPLRQFFPIPWSYRYKSAGVEFQQKTHIPTYAREERLQLGLDIDGCIIEHSKII